MAEDIQHLKNQVWYAEQKLKAAQTERDDWAEQLVKAKGMLADAPCDEFQEMVTAIEEGLADANKQLEPLVEHHAALRAKLPQAPEPAVPKFDPEKHPQLKKTLEKPENVQPVVLNTGDVCEAYWRQDKSWYKAKILSILGSASAPKYQVRYLEYPETVTLDRDAVRPIYKKKHEEPTPAAATPIAAAASSHTISAPASLNPKVQSTKPELPSETLAPKKRKVPNQKALDKTVNSWKNWNSKGVGKKIAQKESMFRSGTTVDSRVGFTGSGAGMTQITKRVRPDNKALAEADEDEKGPPPKVHRPGAPGYSGSRAKRF